METILDITRKNNTDLYELINMKTGASAQLNGNGSISRNFSVYKTEDEIVIRGGFVCPQKIVDIEFSCAVKRGNPSNLDIQIHTTTVGRYYAKKLKAKQTIENYFLEVLNTITLVKTNER